MNNVKVGDIIGHWTVLSLEGKFTRSGGQYVLCRCTCGTEREVSVYRLRNGTSRGCSRPCVYDQGYGHVNVDLTTKRRLLNNVIWNVVARCTNENATGYENYDGRGITVHAGWLADKADFLAYLLTLPGHGDPNLTLDRIDNNRGYEPGNLRFVTRLEQSRNRRRQWLDIPSWNQYFIRMAQVVAKRSKDVTTKVGAVLVDADRTVLSTGFNGGPMGVEDENLAWLGPEKHRFMIHAEHNAILFAMAAVGRRVGFLEACRLYVTIRPCADCLVLAGHVGIRWVMYYKDALSDEQRTEAELVAARLGIEVREWSRQTTEL